MITEAHSDIPGQLLFKTIFFFNTNKNSSWNGCLLVIYLQSEDNLFILLILSEIVSFLFSIPVLLSLKHKTCESSYIVFSLFLLFRILKDLPYLSTFSCFSTYLSFNLIVLSISQWSRTYWLLIFIILICEILKYLCKYDELFYACTMHALLNMFFYY